MRRLFEGLVGLAVLVTCGHAAVRAVSPVPDAVVLSLSEQGTPPRIPVGTPVRAEWDPVDNESLAAVSRYEVQIDAGARVGAGLAVPQARYRYPLPAGVLTPGTHTFSVWACGAEGCGPPATAGFEIVRPLPTIPRNLTIVPGPLAALTLPQAEQRAQAYALWRIDRHLAPAEIGWLAARWPAGQRLDKLSLLHFLDAAPW